MFIVRPPTYKCLALLSCSTRVCAVPNLYAATQPNCGAKANGMHNAGNLHWFFRGYPHAGGFSCPNAERFASFGPAAAHRGA